MIDLICGKGFIELSQEIFKGGCGNWTDLLVEVVKGPCGNCMEFASTILDFISSAS